MNELGLRDKHDRERIETILRQAARIEALENNDTVLKRHLSAAADRIEALEAALRTARGALAWIHNSTEADAIRHRSYEELAAGIYGVAKAALDGEFVDDMHAMEVYDTLYPRAASTPEQP